MSGLALPLFSRYIDIYKFFISSRAGVEICILRMVSFGYKGQGDCDGKIRCEDPNSGRCRGREQGNLTNHGFIRGMFYPVFSLVLMKYRIRIDFEVLSGLDN